MGAQKVNRITNWKTVRARDYTSPPAYSYARQNVAANPWRFESERWNFKPQDLTVIQPNQRRRRTFTGQVDCHTLRFPRKVELRKQLLRIGIIAFIAADLTLLIVFLASVL